ncbi:Esterase/lipase superfamily enzyme [Salinihabitans flavidus]|uniref:Esterase/lipase superfamily enzyme n=1 Tax=Salinihabitans flavidus TaxID=569882 RepID=A0A1H8N4F7_9RHOB|nr:alpha/beta hydrolase [Salinihabitans flavidus]SEO24541.1 Esterase/lipase superfamily enzyme [Salinihabitans flavidus]
MRSSICLVIFLALGNTPPGSASAQAMSGAMLATEMIRIDALVETSPRRALDDVEALLARAGIGASPENRPQFDLLLMRARLLRDTRQTREAAMLLAELGQLAEGAAAAWHDPISLFEQAARLFEEAGELAAARRQIIAIMRVLRASAASEQDLAARRGERDRLTALMEGSSSAMSNTFAATPSPMPFAASPPAAAPPAAASPARPASEQGYHTVDVYYATDRARTGNTRPADFYGAGRGTLETGMVTVTIPDTHTPGEIEAPSVWRLEFSPSPTRHMTLQSIEPLEGDDFFARMNGEFRDAPERDAFVFVHGFNVRFDAAAKRAAQLAFDMRYPGVPVLYSWPSQGRTAAYIADTAVVRLSGRRLADFLQDVVDRSGARQIHLVAHSMGNRALTDALELLSLRNGLPEGGDPLFGQVIFAAPDVDAGLFEAMLPTMRPTAERMTLYSSEADWALETSRRLHGNLRRAGQGGEDTLVSPLIDSIDMSDLGEDFLAHGYFADDPSALADLMLMFWRNLPPGARCGLSAGAQDIPIWRYRIGTCPSREIVPLLAHAMRGQITSAEDLRRIMDENPSSVDEASLERALITMESFLRN